MGDAAVQVYQSSRGCDSVSTCVGDKNEKLDGDRGGSEMMEMLCWEERRMDESVGDNSEVEEDGGWDGMGWCGVAISLTACYGMAMEVLRSKSNGGKSLRDRRKHATS